VLASRARAFELGCYTIDGGGASSGTAPGFNVASTAGQPDAGREIGGPVRLLGDACDVNQDGICDIGDAQRMAQCDVGLVSCTFSCNPTACP